MNALIDWISGNLSSSARIFTAVAPALALLAYALGGLVVYAVRNRMRGEFHDEEMDGRGHDVSTGGQGDVLSGVYGALLASGLKPIDADNPIGRILWLLLATVGLPYLLLATTGPLVQAQSGSKFGVQYGFGYFTLDFTGIGGILSSFNAEEAREWLKITSDSLANLGFVFKGQNSDTVHGVELGWGFSGGISGKITVNTVRPRWDWKLISPPC